MYIATTYSQLAFHDIYFKQNKLRFDSHNHIHEFANQIAGVIVSRPVKDLPPTLPQLLVEDSVRAMFELAFAARKIFQGKVIAATGSNGKSTTVAMVKNILSKDRNIVATVNNHNVGTSLVSAFANYSNDKAYAVLEIGSMALETEWGSITYGLMPHVAVITSITDAHLLEHGTMEGVARAKSNIFCGMVPSGFAVLNRDMPYFDIIEQKAREHFLNVITFGTHPASTVRMEKIQDGETFTCLGKSYVLNCAVPPDQIYDALAAVGVCLALAVPVEVALEQLKSYKMLKGRGETYDATYNGKKIKLINGSFNATFLSIKTGLEYLNTIEKNPAARVAVLGDIAHLGESAEKIHRQLADVILKSNPDRVILCGKYMKILWQDIKDKCRCHWFESGQKLIPELDNLLNDGDCVFVKGSIPANLSLVVNELLNG